MAYNLFVEFSGTVNWKQLRDDVASHRVHVEVFPVSQDALGVSVPGTGANADGWQELQRIFALLRGRGDARIYELYGGSEITATNEQEIRTALLG